MADGFGSGRRGQEERLAASAENIPRLHTAGRASQTAVKAHLAFGAVRPKRIVGLAYPGALLLDLVGPLEVFSLAAAVLADETRAKAPAYHVEIWAARKGDVPTMSNLSVLATQAIGDDLHDVDTILIPGTGCGRPAVFRDRRILNWLQDAAPKVRRIASGCSGAFLLAEAGLLEGRRATTHWRDAETFKRQYSTVSFVKDATFTKDGAVYTCAGATAGIDLALSMVEEDFDRTLSLKIARRMVVFLRRSGEHPQFSTMLASQARSVRFGDVIDWIHQSLRADLSAQRLAEQAGMSPRNFARLFRRELGVTPGEFVRSVRVDAACRLIDGGAGLNTVARECGFASVKQMRRVFLAARRMCPRDYADRVSKGMSRAS